MIAIFCERGLHYGNGHYSRCYVLQQKLKSMGFVSVLHCYDEKEDRRHSWFYQQNILHYLEGIDALIIDSYRACFEVYDLALKHGKKVLVIDDIARMDFPKQCFILNGGIDTRELYCYHTHRVFAGIELMICDPIFFQHKQIQKPIQNLLICFGGSDVNGFTQKVYDLLQARGYHLIIVLGSLCHLEFQGECEVYQNLDAKALSRIFRRVDGAITAGGRMLNELLMSEVPSLVIPTAKNQEHQVRAYAKGGWVVQTSLENLLKDLPKLESIKHPRKLKQKFGSKLEDVLRMFLGDENAGI